MSHMPTCPLFPQGPLIFLVCVVLSREVRRSLRLSCARRHGHDPALATKATLTPVSAGGDTGGARGSHHRGPDVPVPVVGLWL